MREDFYYRLCADLLVVPPLRQRIREDPRELDELLALMVERILGKPSPEVRKLVRSVIDRDLGKDYPWPGNVRELAQCVRRVLLNGTYAGHRSAEEGSGPEAALSQALRDESLDAKGLLAGYCALLHRRHGTWQAVARITGLDRRTAKKYVEEWEEASWDSVR
jgi:transcriptional regulator with PAS, ATPase and Fis domain